MASEAQGASSSEPNGPIVLPAPRFGAYECDTPWNLANAVMHAIGPLTGTASGANDGGNCEMFIPHPIDTTCSLLPKYVSSKQKLLHDFHW